MKVVRCFADGGSGAAAAAGALRLCVAHPQPHIRCVLARSRFLAWIAACQRSLHGLPDAGFFVSKFACAYACTKSHDARPGSDAEIYIELVQGLGETLVGNYPGTALRCVAAKASLQEASGATAPRADAFPDDAVRCAVSNTEPRTPHELWSRVETQRHALGCISV